MSRIIVRKNGNKTEMIVVALMNPLDRCQDVMTKRTSTSHNEEEEEAHPEIIFGLLLIFVVLTRVFVWF